MGMEKLLSIIVPAYNGEKYLENVLLQLLIKATRIWKLY